MVEIPDRLRSLFTGRVDERDGSYVIEVPKGGIERRAVDPSETYRVLVLPGSPGEATDVRRARREGRDERTPPVEKGEVREVTIETLGDRGDGIAKVEHGYVVIVPDTDPGEEATIEIEQVRENVAFARVVEAPTEGSVARDPFERADETDTDPSEPDP